MNQKIVVGIAIIALVLSGLTYFGVKDGSDGRPGRDGRGAVVPNVIEEDRSSMGTVGVTYRGQSIRQATSTICSLRSPRFATSTLTYAVVRIDLASSSATTIVFGKSTDRFATTTPIGNPYAVAANAQAVVIASSSQQLPEGLVRNEDSIFAPGDFLNIAIVGGDNEVDTTHVAAGLVPLGSCKAIFLET